MINIINTLKQGEVYQYKGKEATFLLTCFFVPSPALKRKTVLSFTDCVLCASLLHT